MKNLLCLLAMVFLLQGCIPLLVGGVVGYEMSKNDAKADAQHKEKMDVEKAKLEVMNRQVELEQSKIKK